MLTPCRQPGLTGEGAVCVHGLPRQLADGMLLRIMAASWLSLSRLSARRRYFIAGSGRPSTLCAHPIIVQACGDSGRTVVCLIAGSNVCPDTLDRRCPSSSNPALQ
jgi:hypothetical protein